MEGLCNMVSMNISGRFTGREIKRYGQEVIKYILTDKSVGLFFGQQTNFKPELPIDYEFMGGNKAFLVYDTREIIAGDEKHYKWYLRDLELQDRLPKNYLPEPNYIVCKMKIKSSQFDFIAMSWVTDECMGKHRATSMFKKLCCFIENLAEVEDMPMVISGSFRINGDDAKPLVPPDFRVCSYIPTNRRRNMRQSNFYICSRSLTFTDLKPIVCGKMDIQSNGNSGRNGNVKMINPEDVFYFDPVLSTLQSRQHISITETVKRLDRMIKESKDYVPVKNQATESSPLKRDTFDYMPLKNKDYSPLKKESKDYIPVKTYINDLSPLRKETKDYTPVKKIPRPIINDGYLKKIPMENNDFLYLYEVENDDQVDATFTNNAVESGISIEEPKQDEKNDAEEQKLKKAASFVELYDEEVMQNTGLNKCNASPVLYRIERVNHLLVSLSSELMYHFQQISNDNPELALPDEESTLSAKHADVLHLIAKSTSVENIGPGYY